MAAEEASHAAGLLAPGNTFTSYSHTEAKKTKSDSNPALVPERPSPQPDRQRSDGGDRGRQGVESRR